MKAKRILAALMAAAMAAGMMAGCSKDDKETSSKADSTDSTASSEKEPERLYPLSEEGYPDLDGLTFTFWTRTDEYGSKHPDAHKNNIKLKEWQEKSNFTLEIQSPPVGQEKDAFSIMISSGDWPDIVFLFEGYYGGTVMEGMEDGVVLDCAPYLDTYAPNFMEWVNTNPMFAKLAMDDSGKIIGFGGKFDDAGTSFEEDWWNKDSCPLGLIVRGDYLKEAGLDTPTTIPDWYEMLTKFKDMGIKVPYGYFCKGRDNTEFVASFSGAYDVYHQFMIKQDGKVTYGPLLPEWEEYVKEMTKWYAEGLINPDMAVHGYGDNIAPMLATGECASTTTHVYDYWSRYLVPVVQDGNAPEKDMVDCPFPTLAEGGIKNRFKRSMIALFRQRTILAKTEHPEATIALLDTTYDPEIGLEISKGVEGKAWKLREDGTIEDLHGQLSKESEDAMSIYGGAPMAISFVVHDPHQKALDPRWEDCVMTWKTSCQDGGKLNDNLTLTNEESNIINKYQADLFAYADEWTLKFITGAEPLSKFDEFRAGIEKLHVQEMIDAYQAATDRFNSRGN